MFGYFIAMVTLFSSAVFAVQEILIPECGAFEKINFDRIGKKVIIFCS